MQCHSCFKLHPSFLLSLPSLSLLCLYPPLSLSYIPLCPSLSPLLSLSLPLYPSLSTLLSIPLYLLLFLSSLYIVLYVFHSNTHTLTAACQLAVQDRGSYSVCLHSEAAGGTIITPNDRCVYTFILFTVCMLFRVC